MQRICLVYKVSNKLSALSKSPGAHVSELIDTQHASWAASAPKALFNTSQVLGKEGHPEVVDETAWGATTA